MAEHYNAEEFIVSVLKTGEHTRRYEIYVSSDIFAETMQAICLTTGVNLASIDVRAYKPWAQPKQSNPLEFAITFEVKHSATA